MEYCLTKRTSVLQSQMVNAVEFTLETAFQASYFKSNICIKSAIFNVVGQALSEVVQSVRAPTVSRTKMCHFLQARAVLDRISTSVWSNTVFNVPIAETVENTGDRAVDK